MVVPQDLFHGADVALYATLLLPLLGSIFLFLFGGLRDLTRTTAARWPGLLAVVLLLCSLVLSIWAVAASGHDAVRIGSGEWIPGFGSAWSLQLDWLSSWLLLLVDFIGLMVHVFSLGYMKEDKDQGRYFSALLLFIAMMKVLVLAGNYLLLFAGWEGVGLASYLLIGYHFERPLAAKAATKAFIVNRVADAGLLLGIIAMVITCSSTNFGEIAVSAAHLPHGTIVLVCSMLTIGAIGKSAQFPLHVWLPDAMEGPTPVSALIHSATMVCAGVYLLARSSFLLDLAPEVGQGIAALGAVTALFAATVALVENDIKRVLAYSTISQIGFMFVALGVRADRAAMFHVVTHAFFKALLFLGAGSVIHSLHGDQNLKHMGGLRKQLPVTFATMSIAALTLAGVPGLAAFFSKDLILESTFESGHTLLAVVGLLTSLLTACYSWRLISLAFYGKPQSHHVAVHEGPVSIRIPLIVLAAACVVTGWLIVPIHLSAWPTMLTSSVLAAVGIGLTWHFYIGHPEARSDIDNRFRPIANLLRNRWYIDALYEQRILNGLVLRAAAGAAQMDTSFVDGTVNGASWLSRRVARIAGWFDHSVVDGLVRLVSGSTRFFSWPFRAMQTGFVQTYAFLFIAGVLAVLGYYLIR
jgi:NADH-quinone oxidoreductase subunit L